MTYRNAPVIYIAGYYSANPAQGLGNAIEAWETILNFGWLPFVPHLSFFLDAVYPMPPEFWYEYDLGILAKCDAMYVCEDARTRESYGVNKEIEFATEHGIPIYFSLDELWEDRLID